MLKLGVVEEGSIVSLNLGMLIVLGVLFSRAL
jgi:hypothetical protein